MGRLLKEAGSPEREEEEEEGEEEEEKAAAAGGQGNEGRLRGNVIVCTKPDLDRWCLGKRVRGKKNHVGRDCRWTS